MRDGTQPNQAGHHITSAKYTTYMKKQRVAENEHCLCIVQDTF